MRVVHLHVSLALLASVLTATSASAQDNIILKNGTEIPAKVLEVAPGQIKYRRQDNPNGPVYTSGMTDVLLIRYANGTKDVFGQSTGRYTGTALPASPSATAALPALGTDAVHGLRYHSGFFSRYFTNDTGERLAASTVRSLVATQPDAMQAFGAGQSLRRWSFVTAGTAVVLIAAGATVALMDEGDEQGRRETTDATSTDGMDNRRDNHDAAEVGLALAGGGVVLGVAAVYLRHRATVQFRRAASRYNQQPIGSLQLGPARRGIGVGLTYTF